MYELLLSFSILNIVSLLYTRSKYKLLLCVSVVFVDDDVLLSTID
jgi:hypothetical protein